MNYFLSIQGRIVGPMSAPQVMAYDVNRNTQVSTDGYSWLPLYNFPELMEGLQYKRNTTTREAGSKKLLCGLMAIFFGTLGVQYFVIGKVAGGFISILLSLVTCGLWEIVTLIQGILILAMSDEEFERKYLDNTSTFPLF